MNFRESKIKFALKQMLNFIQIFSPLLLLIVTIIYTYHTRDMAVTMNNQFQQNNRPYLFVENFEWNSDTANENLFDINFKNSGYIPAKYELSYEFYSSASTSSYLHIDIKKEKPFFEKSVFDHYVFPGDGGEKLIIERPSINSGIKLNNGKRLVYKGNDQLLEKIKINERLGLFIKVKYWSVNDYQMKKPFIFERLYEFYPSSKDSLDMSKKVLNTVAN